MALPRHRSLLLVALAFFGSTSQPTIAASSPKLDLVFKEVPLRTALALVFKNSAASYTLDPAVGSKLITAELHTTLDEAVKALAASTGVDARQTSAGVYVIQPKAQEPPIFPPDILEPTPKKDPVDEKMVEKIPLKYADCQEVATLIGGSPLQSRAAQLVLGGIAAGWAGQGALNTGPSPRAPALPGINPQQRGLQPPLPPVPGLQPRAITSIIPYDPDNSLIVRKS